MDELFDKIKDGASKAKDGASKIAKEVAKRTSNAITHTKLTFAYNENQNRIKDVYTEIGKNLYEMHLDGKDYTEFEEELSQIDKLMEEAEMLNEKIAELKNSLKCSECGTFNPVSSVYCSKCGAQLSVEEYADEYEDIAEAFIGDEDEDDGKVIVITPQKPE